MLGFGIAGGVLLGLAATPFFAYATLYLVVRPSGSPAAKEVSESTVSVVLPTYNEEAIVERKLEDIRAQDYPLDRVELVVVDASDDATVERIREYLADHDHPELRILEEGERRGLAVALNEAYAAAKGDIVVKTDCDSKLAPDAIREAVANLADPSVGAVTGRNVEVLGGSAVESGYRDVQARIQMLESHLDSTLIFHGPCSAFERSEIVPVDADSLADDSELAVKIRRDGKRVLYDPAVRYKEAAHSEFRKRRKQKDRRAMGLLRLLWRQRDMVGDYGRFGRVVLPFNWWFMVFSPWLLSIGLLLVVVGAVSGFGPVGLVLPAVILVFGWLGQHDRLGVLQPLYSVLDTQVSLLRAGLELLRGRGDGTWDVDAELREAYD